MSDSCGARLILRILAAEVRERRIVVRLRNIMAKRNKSYEVPSSAESAGNKLVRRTSSTFTMEREKGLMFATCCAQLASTFGAKA